MRLTFFCIPPLCDTDGICEIRGKKSAQHATGKLRRPESKEFDVFLVRHSLFTSIVTLSIEEEFDSFFRPFLWRWMRETKLRFCGSIPRHFSLSGYPTRTSVRPSVRRARRETHRQTEPAVKNSSNSSAVRASAADICNTPPCNTCCFYSVAFTVFWAKIVTTTPPA